MKQLENWMEQLTNSETQNKQLKSHWRTSKQLEIRLMTSNEDSKNLPFLLKNMEVVIELMKNWITTRKSWLKWMTELQRLRLKLMSLIKSMTTREMKLETETNTSKDLDWWLKWGRTFQNQSSFLHLLLKLRRPMSQLLEMMLMRSWRWKSESITAQSHAQDSEVDSTCLEPEKSTARSCMESLWFELEEVTCPLMSSWSQTLIMKCVEFNTKWKRKVEWNMKSWLFIRILLWKLESRL